MQDLKPPPPNNLFIQYNIDSKIKQKSDRQTQLYSGIKL